MIQDYLILATRIRQELSDLKRSVTRAKRAVAAGKQYPEDQDLYMDSAALNMHDFYSGFERVFQQIGATVDGHIPTSHDWHRQLLRQMEKEVADLRPPVLSPTTVQDIDEFLRFRHVVRNIYAFEFD